MRIATVFNKFIELYEEARENPMVRKPISYALYFNSVGSLPTQTVAICSYIDPVVAIILSALVLKEPMGVWEIIGAVLLLGAAIACEMPMKPQKKGRT